MKRSFAGSLLLSLCAFSNWRKASLVPWIQDPGDPSIQKGSMDNNICNLNFIEGEWITCKNNFCPTLEILVLEKEWIMT